MLVEELPWKRRSRNNAIGTGLYEVGFCGPNQKALVERRPSQRFCLKAGGDGTVGCQGWLRRVQLSNMATRYNWVCIQTTNKT